MTDRKDPDIRQVNLRVFSKEISQDEFLAFLKNHYRVDINFNTDGADLTISLRRKLTFPG